MKAIDSNKFILGAGVTGLVLAHILKDHTILTNNIGGLQSKGFPLGPQILHDSPKVREFLASLNIKAEPKEFKIGYVKADGTLTNSVSDEDRQAYYNKTRGNGQAFESSCLSGGKNTVVGYDIAKINLVLALLQSARFRTVFKQAYTIDTEKRLINNYIRYEDLISTIDLSILQGMVKDAPKMVLEKNEVFFTKVAYRMDPEFDYVYFIHDPNINRITKLDDSYAVVESKYPINRNQWMVTNSIALKTQIKTPKHLESLKGIQLVGRFAQYSQSVKINDVIERWWK